MGLLEDGLVGWARIEVEGFRDLCESCERAIGQPASSQQLVVFWLLQQEVGEVSDMQVDEAGAV